MDLKKLLQIARDKDASDLHLVVGQPPIVRLNGFLSKIEDADVVEQKDIVHCIDHVFEPRFKDDLEQKGTADFGMDIDSLGRFRVNVFKERKGFGAAFRLIPHTIRTVEELGLPSILNTVALLEKGLVLVTGPTGSGKSTTLAAMIDKINAECRKHIITIEDPIEFVHEHKNCIVHQREIGTHATSFKDALRSAFREDPDVILVGEMRDLETISMAITAAETGHVVFATLHTVGAPETINRIIDAFPSDQQAQIRTQFCEVIEMVLSQTLIPTKDLSGRVAGTEILFGTAAVRNLIREAKTHQLTTIMQTNIASGMHEMSYSLQRLLQEDKITLDEVEKRTPMKGKRN